MKRLRRFDYHEPATLDEAVEILGAEEDARVLAGGTDLVVDMKLGRMRPRTVVNIKRIPGLTGIESLEGGTRIGALTKVTAIHESALVERHHPALADAARVLATPPVRAMATIAGNVARASPASDLSPPLIVHGAVAAITGRAGPRREPVEGLHAGPGTTNLARDDIITAIDVPEPPTRFGSAHLKIGTRGSGTDIAMVGVSAGLELAPDSTITRAHVVMASVAPTPLRATAAEQLLQGASPTSEAFTAAAEAAAGEAEPISDVRSSAAHRTALVRVLTMRALQAALARANGRGRG